MQTTDEEFYCDFCKAFGVADVACDYPTVPPGWLGWDAPHACSHECWEALGLSRTAHMCEGDCPWRVFEGPTMPPPATQRPFVFGEGRVRDGYVYFIQVEDDGPIKIGFAADIRQRLSGLQTSSPFALNLLAWIEGTEADERALHAVYSAHRMRGEWFHPVADLCKAIEQYRMALL